MTEFLTSMTEFMTHNAPIINLVATVVIAIFAAVTALFARRTVGIYGRLAQLAAKQNEIADRNLWYAGALESQSTVEHIIRAHERGIPVMWWDPHKERWNPNKQPWHPGRGHRKLAQLPLAIMYVPEEERGPGIKTSAPDAKPFSVEELAAIEAERSRLMQGNAGLAQVGGEK